MCLVLDTNVFSDFFDSNNANFSEYEPVRNWVFKGAGKLLYGGKKYKDEMRMAKKYLRFFASLDRAGKIIKLDDDKVNSHQIKVKELEDSKDFDDPHLIAIIIESKCQLICTNDKRAIPYIKNNKFYPKGIKCPKIYSSKRNHKLLSNYYISEICKPCPSLSNKKATNLLSKL